MDFKKYESKFRQRKTSSLIKGYGGYNAEFRRIARSEFKKRRVPINKLPYKKPVRRTQRMGYNFNAFR